MSSAMQELRRQHLEKILEAARELCPAGTVLWHMIKGMDEALAKLAVNEAVDAEQAKAQKLADQMALLDKIIAWSADHLRFNPEYVLRMRTLVDTGHPLTDGQVVAIDNIVEKWEMELNDY